MTLARYWMTRPGYAPSKRPNEPGSPVLLLGTVRFVWFQALNSSMPTWNFSASVIIVFLKNEKSVFQIEGPRQVLRPRLPKLTVWPAEFTTFVIPTLVEKAAGFMNRSRAVPENGSPTSDGRIRPH